jgi:hypothetical protein
MARRPLVFFCPGKFSFGELQNVITVARQFPPGDPVEFLVAEQYLDIVRRSGVEANAVPQGPGNREATMSLLRDMRPLAVVVADHHLLALERGNVSAQQLMDLGCPVIAMDSLCLGPGASTLTMALARQPGTAPIHRWFPPETAIPALPADITLMRAVPVAGLGRPADSFNLYGEGLRPARTKAEVFSSLGISSMRSLVVAAQSGWATSAYGLLGRVSRNADTDTYRSLKDRWAAEMFSRTGRPVTVLELSSSTRKATVHDNVEFLPCPYLPMDDFADILGAADLYVTDNVTSGAMAKAATLGTPVLALVNQHNERSGDPFSAGWLAEMEAKFPGFGVRFLVNPFGWAEELAPLLYRNDYMAALPKAEIYNLDACVAAVQELLGQRDGPATLALNRQVAGLPTAAALIRERVSD